MNGKAIWSRGSLIPGQPAEPESSLEDSVRWSSPFLDDRCLITHRHGEFLKYTFRTTFSITIFSCFLLRCFSVRSLDVSPMKVLGISPDQAINIKLDPRFILREQSSFSINFFFFTSSTYLIHFTVLGGWTPQEGIQKPDRFGPRNMTILKGTNQSRSWKQGRETPLAITLTLRMLCLNGITIFAARVPFWLVTFPRPKQAYFGALIYNTVTKKSLNIRKIVHHGEGAFGRHWEPLQYPTNPGDARAL